MVKNLNSIKIYDIAESGNTVALYINCISTILMQIVVGITLMTYVVQKARVELREALSNSVSSSLHGQPGAKQIPDFIV